MPEKRTLFERFSNRFYAIPAVAQWWGKRTAVKTANFVDLSIGIPFARLRQPLSQCRVALLTTGGIHLPSQTPFDMENPDGDPTYREIPNDVDAKQLVITHKYYDHSDADADLNVIFPLQHFRDLVKLQVIGELNRRHFGLMGHIDNALVDTLNQWKAPEIAAKLRADGVDFAFLTPAWGQCNRSVGLIARAIEANGIPTVSVSITKDLTESVGVPRAVFVKWPLGHPLGEPNQPLQQRTMIFEALKLLKEADKAGIIHEPGFRWKRQSYSEPDWSVLAE